MGTDYWDEILPFIDKMAKAGMIAPSDLELVHATNSVDDATARIRTHAIERFGLRVASRVRPHRRWLGERGLPPPLTMMSNLGLRGGASEHSHRRRHSDTEVTR
jgi:hypothetical protein